MEPKKTKKALIKSASSYAPKKKPLELPYIELQIKTWLKDSHGLFDYEALENKCESQTLAVVKSSKIYRHVTTMRTQIVDDSDTRQIPAENIYIGTVTIDRESKAFKLQSASVSGVQPPEIVRKEHPDIYNNSYLVVKSYQKEQGVEGYPLGTNSINEEAGNVIRLGRIEYLVLQARNNETTDVFKQTSHLELNTSNYIVDTPLTGSCKICLCEQSTEEDPLISPCLCKGSCEFIHVGCLRNWINSKVKKELSDIVVSYNFSKFECEICKAPFPKNVTMIKGDILEMITIEKPNKPYLMLESVNGKDDTKKERNLHMIFSNEGLSLKVGRGHNCQMRVNDISVSRVHAQVRFEKNRFYLKDLKSKFGTLIKFKEECEIQDGLEIQYGRVCFKLNVKREQPKYHELQTNEDDDNSVF